MQNVYGNINKTNASQQSSGYNANNDNPINHFPSSSATNENNATASSGTIAKELKEVKPIHLENLIFQLSFIIVRSTHQGLMNTATILIRLHDSPKQSLKNLQKLTGLSDDGIGKRIVSMKRFGLITRAAGRQLLLTEKALRAIEKSRM